MSKGWESKSVEEQQAERLSEAGTAKQKVATSHLEDADRKRARQALELQRERILSERTSSPHRRSALTNALADVEEKLSELGWTLHL
jgi:alanine racemase